jgi:large subunit ribosomal protein L12
MEYIYAALLLHRLNKEINEENLVKVIEAAGANPNLAKIKALVAALSEVNIDEAVKSAIAAPSVVTPTTAPAEEAPKEEAKEEKKEEEKEEEEALAGLSSLFG